jgi:hypothetical protein
VSSRLHSFFLVSFWSGVSGPGSGYVGDAYVYVYGTCAYFLGRVSCRFARCGSGISGRDAGMAVWCERRGCVRSRGRVCGWGSLRSRMRVGGVSGVWACMHTGVDVGVSGGMSGVWRLGKVGARRAGTGTRTRSLGRWRAAIVIILWRLLLVTRADTGFFCGESAPAADTCIARRRYSRVLVLVRARLPKARVLLGVPVVMHGCYCCLPSHG